MADDYPELLSLAVHELRTPASVVSGYLRMILKGSDALTDQQRKMITEAEKSCARMTELISELSDVSKLDRNMVELRPEPFELFAMLSELAASVHEARDREVVLQIRGVGANARFAGDIARVRSAFNAFFRAILREQAAQVTVVVDCRRIVQGDRVSAVVIVAPAHAVSQAYDSAPGPFVEKRGGLGLALPIARRVIEQHGGTVWSPAGDPKMASSAIIVSLPLQA